MALRDVVDALSNYRVALFDVEPPGVPSFQRGIQWYIDVLAGHPISELQVHTADQFGTTATFFLQTEQVPEEVEVWKIPRYASQKWIKTETCSMVFGCRLHRLIAQNSSR